MINDKKSLALGLLLFFSILTGIIYWPFLIDETTSISDLQSKFDGERARSHIQNITDLGPRFPGSDSIENSRIYIKNFFENHTECTYFSHNFTKDSIDCQNLLFKLNEGKERILIFSTHYDTRIKATKEQDSNAPIEGAVDGTSGVGVILEMTKVFTKQMKDINAEIWLLFFDAEDQGKDEEGEGISGWNWGEGSQAFRSDINEYFDSEQQEIDCLINIDMVGVKGYKIIADVNSNPIIHETIFRTGRNAGFKSYFPYYQVPTKIIDDHLFFQDIFPVCLIMSDFIHSPYHHTTSDTIDLIDTSALDAVGETLELFTYDTYHHDSPNKINANKWSGLSFFNIHCVIIGIIFDIGVLIVYLQFSLFFKRKERQNGLK